MCETKMALMILAILTACHLRCVTAIMFFEPFSPGNIMAALHVSSNETKLQMTFAYVFSFNSPSFLRGNCCSLVQNALPIGFILFVFIELIIFTPLCNNANYL